MCVRYHYDEKTRQRVKTVELIENITDWGAGDRAQILVFDMRQKVFYSWQSDTEPSHNRCLLEESLKQAIVGLNRELPVELELDQASEEVHGLVDIPDHIRDKLERCAIFVADVTMVGKVRGKEKWQPNSNVYLELGYVWALMRKAGMEPVPIVLVMNTHYGTVATLPFDLGRRPVIEYKLHENAGDKERRQAQEILLSRLTTVLRSIVEGGQLFSGLSREAWMVGCFFSRAWEVPLSFGHYYDSQEIAKGTEQSAAEIERGAAELSEKGYLQEPNGGVCGSREGWPVKPTAHLFVLFDPWCREWDPKTDATRILNEFGTESGKQLRAAEIQERLGWEQRRLEPAMASLIHDQLAEELDERGPPYSYPWIRLTRRAELFMRDRFNPEELIRRG